MLRRVLLTLAVTALASCRTVPVHEGTAASWELRRPQLQQRAHFELKGRVAVAAGGEGFNASLRWVQRGSQTNMSLDGPLGAGGVKVTSDGEAVSIVTSNGQRLDDEA